MWSSNSTPSSKAKRTENTCPHKNLYINVHSCIIHKTQKVKTTQMSNWCMDQKKKKCPYSGIFGHETEWSIYPHYKQMNLKNSMLTERSQTQRATYWMIPFILKAQNRQIHINKVSWWLPRAGQEEREWEVTTGRSQVFGWWKCSKLIMVMTAQICEYAKNHWSVHFKMVNGI